MRSVLLVGVLTCGMLTATSMASGGHSAVARLHVSDHPVHWESPYRVKKMLNIRITVNGHDIPYERVHRCIGFAGGRGAAVKLNGCGPGAQSLRITAIALRPVYLLVRFRYR